MAEYKNIILQRDGKIARIILNRPKKVNALSGQLLNELFAALEELDNDDDQSVVIIKGAGRGFSTGYDISPTETNIRKSFGPQLTRPVGSGRQWLHYRGYRWAELFEFRKPVIAQVHGWCLAGANELAGNCDLIICAEDAQFGHPAGRQIGTLPNTHSIWPFTIGMRRTKQMFFTGRSITGKRAAEWGMVNEAVPAAELEERVEELARDMSLVPLNFLEIHKSITNQLWKRLGYYDQLDRALELSEVFHACPEVEEFARMVKERGLNATFDARDGKFGDYRTGTKKPT